MSEMRVVVAFESMYGHTHAIATAVASGFDPDDDVAVLPVSALGAAERAADVLVVGMPTHAHGLPRPASRRAAVEGAHSAYGDLPVEPTASGSGVREWLSTLPNGITGGVATFDTRFRAPGWLAGHPASRVLRHLTRAGGRPLARAESFFVNRREELRPGELDRAKRWGAALRQRALRQVSA